MKCYKCNKKIAVVEIYEDRIHPRSKNGTSRITRLRKICLPCLYEHDDYCAKQIMPFTKSSLEKIREGKKWTSLRSAIPKYDKYPFKLTRVYVTEDFITDDCGKITDEVVKSEGFKTLDELITALKKMKHRIPKEMWLYDLRKPIK